MKELQPRHGAHPAPSDKCLGQKLWAYTHWNTAQPSERMKFCQLGQRAWILRAARQAKEVRQKRTTTPFLLGYKTESNRLTRTDNRRVAPGGRGAGGGEEGKGGHTYDDGGGRPWVEHAMQYTGMYHRTVHSKPTRCY